MRLVDMTTFVALVRNKHFGRTAQELHTTQPAVSSRLSALEEEFGCRLIDRASGGFKVTAEGEQVLQVVQEVLAKLDKLKGDLRQPNNEAPVVIRIGAIDSVSSTWMPRLVENLHQSFSNIRIELTVESTQRLVQGMTKGEFDLIFAVDPAVGDGFRTFVSCVLTMLWAGAPSLVEQDRIYTVGDIADLPIITFPKNTAPYRQIAPYFEDERVLGSKVTSSNSMFAIINMIIDGFGVAAVPAVTIRRELREGLLVPLQVAKKFPAMAIMGTYQCATHQDIILKVVNEAQACARAFFAEYDPGAVW